ncbi:MAG: hypothetical protein QNJ44_15585 [Rhodobacter sp.]|nr:hypothetical protein [Rhodobacter sp.]
MDLNAELVLSSSADEKPPQEELDALASMVSMALGLPDCPADRAAPGSIAPDEVIVLSPELSTVIVRTHGDEAEALCCVCARSQDVEIVRASARDTLNEIAATSGP